MHDCTRSQAHRNPSNRPGPTPSGTRHRSVFQGISGRLLVGLGLIVVLGVGIGATGLSYLASVERTLNQITDITAPSVETADDMIANIWETNKIAEEIIADEELSDVEQLASEFAEKSQMFYTYMSELEALVHDEALLAHIEEARREHQNLSNIPTR